MKASKNTSVRRPSAASLKRAQGIVDAVLTLDGHDRESVVQYWQAGTLFLAGIKAGDWTSEATAVAFIHDHLKMVIAQSRINRGTKVAVKFTKLADALKAYDSSRFGTTMTSFLAACGVKDTNAARNKAAAAKKAGKSVATKSDKAIGAVWMQSRDFKALSPEVRKQFKALFA